MQPFCHKEAFKKAKEFLSIARQYTCSMRLISEAMELYNQYRNDCKAADSIQGVLLNEYLDRFTDIIELAKDNGADMRVKDKRMVVNIIELLRHDAKSHVFTYIKGEEKCTKKDPM